MRHASTQEVFEYWNARRGARAVPDRTEIEPAAIRRVLADTFILSFDPMTGHPFRVAGTRVCALFGREIKGEPFLHLFSRDARPGTGELLAVIAHESVGVVASVRECKAGGQGPGLELLLLPLSWQGRTDARLLGALAPSRRADWLGTHTLGALALGPYRFIGHGGLPARAPELTAQARPRHGFLVYEGGRSQRC
jgi:hypothetical protein